MEGVSDIGWGWRLVDNSQPGLPTSRRSHVPGQWTRGREGTLLCRYSRCRYISSGKLLDVIYMYRNSNVFNVKRAGVNIIQSWFRLTYSRKPVRPTGADSHSRLLTPTYQTPQVFLLGLMTVTDTSCYVDILYSTYDYLDISGLLAVPVPIGESKLFRHIYSFNNSHPYEGAWSKYTYYSIGVSVLVCILSMTICFALRLHGL